MQARRRIRPSEGTGGGRQAYKESKQEISPAVPCRKPPGGAAIGKHRRTWDIWDKEDISLRVRELCKDEQRKLVDIFFQGQRLALIGEVEPGPWQTAEDFFAPFMVGRGAFRHTWGLIGRDQETQNIVDGLSNDTIKVVVLVGPGGGGKSRILKQAVDRYEAIAHGTLVRFLSPTSDVTDKSLEDLGSGRKILVVDDAHDRNDLPLLFQYAAIPANQTTLLLSLRPYGLDYVKAQAGTFALSGASVQEVRLVALTLEQAKALAAEVLTEYSGPVEFAKQIARVTGDCPLAIVMASHIVAKEGHQLELTKNDDSFRSTLLGKFQDVIAGEIGHKSDAEAIRKLLRVLALLQPFHPDDPVIAKTVQSVERLSVPDVNRLIRLLSDAGVLFKRGGQYRLSPDLLADFIIEKACIGETGQSTGYAEQVFDAAGGAHLQHLLVNLGKLDWRLAKGDTSNSRLMDGIWARLNQRHPPIKAVTEVAYFQPERALRFADDVMRNGVYAYDLTDLLKYASYSWDCAPRACQLLWQLVTHDDENPSAERAVKVLADLAAVEVNKPFEYNQLIVEFGLSLLEKDDSWRGKYTPFHILEGILRTEGEICESTGGELRIQRYSVSAPFAAPLRKQAIDATVKLLSHANIKIALAAAQFLKKSVHYPMPGGPRAEWTREFVSTLEKIEKTIQDEPLDPLVAIELASSVTWLAHYANDEATPVAKRILAAMPGTLDFRTTLALVDEYGQIFERTLDFEKNDRDRIARLDALTTDLVVAFPDAGDLYAYIQKHLQHIRDNGCDEKGLPSGLYWKLLDASPVLVDVTIEKAFRPSAGEETSYAAAALAMELQKDRASGIELANRFLESDSGDLHAAASRAYNSLDPETFGAEDLDIVRRILAWPNTLVVANALSVVRRIAGRIDKKLAIDLLRIVDFGESSKTADHVMALFGHVIPLEQLSERDVQEYLDKLMAIPRLDGHWIDTFLQYASQHHADITAQFFMNRVEYSADNKDRSYRPCNYGPFGHIPLRFQDSKEFNDILRRVVNWMKSRGEDDYHFHKHSGQLFETMFGLVDDRILGFVADWLDIAKPAELKSISAIFRKASEDFILTHRDMVVRLLEKAEGFGKDMLRSIISDLYGAAVGGMRSGVPGVPFPRDLKMKEEADKALKDIPRFSPAYELYDAVRKHAESDIARCRQEAELYDD